jgi:hypothetical protein
MKIRRQVSVRGEVYDRLKRAAVVRGMRISQLVEAALEDGFAQAARTVDPAPVEGVASEACCSSPAAPPGEQPHEQTGEVSQPTRRAAEA